MFVLSVLTSSAAEQVSEIPLDQLKHIGDFPSDEAYWEYAVDQYANLSWKDANTLGVEMRSDQATQEKIKKYQAMRSGMFIHWGICSVADGIWNGKKFNTMPEFLMYQAEIPRVGYVKEYGGKFNPVNFDADRIARLARDAGMKYLVFTAKHVDGFCMYNSKYTRLDVIDATPFKRDILRELETACKKHGIKLGIYYSQDWDWLEGGLGNNKEDNEKSYRFNHWDPSSTELGSNREYFLKKSLPQIRELLTNYDISYVWFDVGEEPDTVALAFWETVKKYAPETPVTGRIGRGNYWGEVNIPGDNGFIHAKGFPHRNQAWEGCFTINHNWGFKPDDTDWKTAQDLTFLLVQTVARDGNALIDIGPTKLGDVPRPAVDALEGMGEWLQVNGECIYGVAPWYIDHEGPFTYDVEESWKSVEHGGSVLKEDDFWFTRRDNAIYVINLAKSDNRKVVIKSLSSVANPGQIVQHVSLVGGGELPWMNSWYQNDQGLTVTLPQELPSDIGFVLKVEL